MRLLGAALLLGGAQLSLAAGPLDNAACLTCHDAKAQKIEVPKADGKPRSLIAFGADKYGSAVHGGMQCVACHTGIADMPAAGEGHKKDAPQALKSVACADCHAKLWADAQKDGSAAQKPRLGTVAKNIEAYRKSFHASPGKADKTKPIAYCDDCHDTHTFAVPAKAGPARDEWRMSTAAVCGEKCHSEALEAYSGSVHGKEVLEKKNKKAAVCIDCHTSHAIGNTSAVPIKLAITANCGSCHEEQYKSYKATYHGQITTLGYANTAKCYDCHGSHEALAVKNKESKVHPDNRLETCSSCHNGKKVKSVASAGFVSFQPHARTDNFERYPQVWLGFKMMIGLLVGTFAFFWLHTALWFFREWKERKEGVLRPHVATAALGAGGKPTHFRRFSLTWRVAHLTFALSLMVLTLTGIPLMFAEAPWAPGLMRALGGPEVAGTIHRACAIVFAGVFFWHLGYMALQLWRKRATFDWLGPDSMIPWIQDGKDILAMFKWFFGQGPRPQFDRWTYWEKFDYWAPFWGVTIIGVSGLVMWMPNTTATFLPGWVFNVAAIFHGEEAFLAVVFLFTVHFFNNHFRPAKFPLETVMFTGAMELEEFKREHPLQYERLKKSGELEQHLVQAPSAPMAKGSRVLGFTLIAAGLALLFTVAVGFFTTIG